MVGQAKIAGQIGRPVGQQFNRVAATESMSARTNEFPYFRLDPEFFLQLSLQARLRGFTGLKLSTRKFPLLLVVYTLLSPRDQYPPVFLYNSRNDGSNFDVSDLSGPPRTPLFTLIMQIQSRRPRLTARMIIGRLPFLPSTRKQVRTCE